MKDIITDLPAGPGRIVLLQERLYFEAPPDPAQARPRLRAGGQDLPCQRLEDPAPLLARLPRTQRPETLQALLSPQIAPLVGQGMLRLTGALNTAPEWAVPGRASVRLGLESRDIPQRLHFANILTASPGPQPQAFHILLAAHRLRGQGRVIVHSSTGAQLGAVEFTLDPGATGGPEADRHQSVTVALPQGQGPVTIGLEIAYLGYCADGSGMDPFLFLTDPQIHSQPDTPDPCEPVLLRATAGAGPLGWYSAGLSDCLDPEAGLRLSLAGQACVELALPCPALRIVEDFGHAITLQSESRQRVVLFLDGHPRAALTLEGTHYFPFPTDWLDGAHHRLSIRDSSGTQRLLERIVLLPKVITPAEICQRESMAPWPVALFAQTAHRYESLKRHMAAAAQTPEAHPPGKMAQLAHALAMLEAGPERCTPLAPLHFPELARPDVSIIMPAHNQIRMTYLALCSLLLAWNRASFEVILVDDGSQDDTARIETIVQGIRVLRHASPQRFIRACNGGAALARGRHIALLNNDVEVTCGWLDALLAALRPEDRVGLVGAKLLFPDGRLQEAGGLIWGSGNPWNYGKGQNPWEPRFCYTREADYLSGAALLLKTSLWQKVGGLSSYLEPMYFEDTDLAFKIRALGLRTLFVPGAIVYHHEGATSGTDPASGLKAFQEINRPRFKKRWGRAFAGFGQEGVAPDLEKDRGIVGRVLFVDYTTPRPDQDAGSYAALQEMALVQSLGYKVSFLPTNLAHFGSYTEALQARGIEAIYAPFFRSVGDYLTQHLPEFDAVYFTRYHVARELIDLVRTHAPGAKILFNNADLHFLREMRQAQSSPDPALLETARQTRAAELEVIGRVDVVLSYSEAEHAVIAACTEGQARVVKCPWVAELPRRRAGLRGRRGLSFLGSYRHPPNAEGIAWFAREILPQLGPSGAATELHLYGAGMNDAIRALEGPGLRVHGFVAKIAQAFEPHRIFVAPLLSGAGVKGKVIAAMAHGIPCVLSPAAAEGIGLRHGHDCLIAQQPADWTDAILRLTQDDALWHSLSENARRYIGESFSFTQGRALMRAAFEAVEMYHSLP